MPELDYDLITTPAQLKAHCDALARAPWIAFDTEFVSEHTYRSELCLVQVATPAGLAVIDPFETGDLSLFWETLAHGQHETIVHAGREELCFCLDATGSPLHNLFDVQIAAGLMGLEYPAGYGTLISKLLGKTLHKRETRTDWRRRPLSAHQLDYALDDVRDLYTIHQRLRGELEKLHRLDWLAVEMASWIEEVQHSRGRERWRKVCGSTNMSSRELAIVRELWLWREAEAQQRNWPVRRVLRDDLIVELAKRRTADERQIRAVRGLDRGDLQRQIPGMSRAIAKALALEDGECPRSIRRDSKPQLSLVAQFLASALSSICRSAQVAPSIVGTASDVRDLVLYRLGEDGDDAEVPLLARGWRAEVVGKLIEDLLSGQVAIRIHDPRSDHPLVFDPVAR